MAFRRASSSPVYDVVLVGVEHVWEGRSGCEGDGEGGDMEHVSYSTQAEKVPAYDCDT